MKNLTGILLCGGKSSRMGKDKYSLLFNNKPMYTSALDSLQSFCNEIIISANKDYPEFRNYKVLNDEIKEIGPMGGIYTCLKAAKNNYCIVMACDMPLITGHLLSKMLEMNGYDAVVPIIKSLPQPLYAIYSKNILPIIDKRIQSGNFSLLNMLKQMNVSYVDSQYHSHELKNINTPEDLINYEQSFTTI